MIDRSRIAELVREVLKERGETPRDGHTGAAVPILLAPDRGQNLGSAFEPHVMDVLFDATPARIGVGRTGTRYRTNTLLRFRADHAFARDAVMCELDEKLLRELGLEVFSTRATSKAEFLKRPDLGRALSDTATADLAKAIPQGLPLVVVYGDGLSSAALNTHLRAFHPALVRGLAHEGIRHATPFFVRYSRVKVMDEIARITRAAAAVFVCGERPGLGFSDSLSAYYMYCTQGGATDADREVISNINPRGTTPEQAGPLVAEACARVLRARKSGVIL